MATEIAVRAMIEDLHTALGNAGIDEDLQGSITLAVGEALNNIVEHAYAGGAPGPINLNADILPKNVCVTLRDTGRVLPGGGLPPVKLPDNSGPLDTLPEGGFGWFLIHDLCHSLTYTRKHGLNTLCMTFLYPGDTGTG